MIIFYFFTLIYRIFNCTILIVLVTDNNNAKNLIGAFISNNVWFVNQFLWVIFFFQWIIHLFSKTVRMIHLKWLIYLEGKIISNNINLFCSSYKT